MTVRRLPDQKTSKDHSGDSIPTRSINWHEEYSILVETLYHFASDSSSFLVVTYFTAPCIYICPWLYPWLHCSQRSFRLYPMLRGEPFSYEPGDRACLQNHGDGTSPPGAPCYDFVDCLYGVELVDIFSRISAPDLMRRTTNSLSNDENMLY